MKSRLVVDAASAAPSVFTRSSRPAPALCGTGIYVIRAQVEPRGAAEHRGPIITSRSFDEQRIVLGMETAAAGSRIQDYGRGSLGRVLHAGLYASRIRLGCARFAVGFGSCYN